eukprot:15329654-Ditylum_brightwellii.AAC.2
MPVASSGGVSSGSSSPPISPTSYQADYLEDLQNGGGGGAIVPYSQEYTDYQTQATTCKNSKQEERNGND